MSNPAVIKRQFETLIESWLIGDCHLLVAQTRPLNFTLLAIICIGINALGNYRAGTTERGNAKVFLDNYMPEYSWLWQAGNWPALREDLLHQFLPKEDWRIIWAPGKPYLQPHDQKSMKRLDALAFFAAFKKAALNYKVDLLADRGLQDNFQRVLVSHSNLVVGGVSQHSATIIRVPTIRME